eukprot:Pgem_evm2s19382
MFFTLFFQMVLCVLAFLTTSITTTSGQSTAVPSTLSQRLIENTTLWFNNGLQTSFYDSFNCDSNFTKVQEGAKVTCMAKENTVSYSNIVRFQCTPKLVMVALRNSG